MQQFDGYAWPEYYQRLRSSVSEGVGVADFVDLKLVPEIRRRSQAVPEFHANLLATRDRQVEWLLKTLLLEESEVYSIPLAEAAGKSEHIGGAIRALLEEQWVDALGELDADDLNYVETLKAPLEDYAKDFHRLTSGFDDEQRAELVVQVFATLKTNRLLWPSITPIRAWLQYLVEPGEELRNFENMGGLVYAAPAYIGRYEELLDELKIIEQTAKQTAKQEDYLKIAKQTAEQTLKVAEAAARAKAEATQAGMMSLNERLLDWNLHSDGSLQSFELTMLAFAKEWHAYVAYMESVGRYKEWGDSAIDSFRGIMHEPGLKTAARQFVALWNRSQFDTAPEINEMFLVSIDSQVRDEEVDSIIEDLKAYSELPPDLD